MMAHCQMLLQRDPYVLLREDFMDEIPIELFIMFFIVADPQNNRLLGLYPLFEIVELGNELTI